MIIRVGWWSVKVILLTGILVLSIMTCKKPEREMKVILGSVTSITSNSVEISSNIDDIGEGVSQHGHCYSKSQNPEIGDSRTQMGAPRGTGPFQDQLTGLEAGTQYYVRAYLYNGKETVYSKEEKTFTTLQPNLPVFVSAVVENAAPSIVEMTYSQTLANIVPAASAFTVTVNSESTPVSSVAISGTKVQLTLASAVINGSVVTVAYTKPASNPIQTSAGGQAATITSQSVTNNVAAAVPVFVSAVVENATPAMLEMTYNQTLANIVPAASAFTVTVNSVSRTVSSVAISGTKVQLTLASAVVYGNVVTVAYTKPATNPIQTTAGGQAASITAQSVTNNVAAAVPAFVIAVVENAAPSILEMTYSQTLANIIPAASAFTVTVNSVSRTVSSVAISGTKVQLTLASAVVNGNVVTVAYTKPATNPIQTSAGGQAASITAQTVTNNVAAIPVFVSAVVENATPAIVEMTYSQTLANIIPAASAFTVTVNSVSRTVSSVAITGTKVQLTLASAVVNGNVVTVAYTKPATNPIQTSAGGQAASITAQSVTNNVAAAVPAFVSAVVENAAPSILEMTYSQTLANIVPASSAFTVMVNSVARTVSSVAISGTKVQLTLASAVVNGNVVTVAYTKPATNPIQTSAGGQAATITAQSVTNNVAAAVPVFVSAVVENATPAIVEMTYSLTLANIVPASSAFTVMVNSVARTVSLVAISGTKVQLTLASAVVNGNVVTVAYTKPATNPIQTSAGGQAATITAQSVTNYVIPPPTDVLNPITGKTWLDRNLGATQLATSSTDTQAYGDLYQWGRAADGHQLRTSGTTTTLSSSDTPGHGNFILAPDTPEDWRSPQNTNLWQGVGGVNNPCPTGYRLPTEAEWDAERLSWSSANSTGAFTSPLKLPLAGFRSYLDGSLSNVGSYGYYWSSTVSSAHSRHLFFVSSGAGMLSSTRAYGVSVRCLKDY